jgi:glycosyltransferase involved in cell wall biosynthesis
MDRFISVAITHYNNTKYIKEAIQPLLNDNRISEIVICDDKSHDISKLEEMVNKYNNKKIKLYKNSSNLGCYHNKINAVSKCTNDWTILLDSDNIYPTRCIDVLYNIKIWEQDTIYVPSWAVTFPNRVSDMMDYRKYNNTYITKNIYINDFNDSKFQCLMNTCNYFLPVQNFLNIMNKSKSTYQREKIDALDSAVLFTDWLCNKQNIYVVENLHYDHRMHRDSNYRKSNSHCHSEAVKSELLYRIARLKA